MNSAKSPIESLSTRASRACGTLDRSFEPPVTDLAWRVGFEFEFPVGFARIPLSLPVDEERDLPVAGRRTS
jgi:hypothetical protein